VPDFLSKKFGHGHAHGHGHDQFFMLNVYNLVNDMQKIEKSTVRYLANLARLAVSAEEEDALLTDLKKIINYVEQLHEIDTTDVPPCSYVTQCLTQTPVRKDEVTPTLERDTFLKLCPEKTAGMVRIPTVLKPEE
jgi:aspartyl-tRNA(Asn)/glutamyl-tRNA(Gln) amidotransferase subunit C